MTAQVAQNLPFAKFTRAGFGFSSKNRTTTEAPQNDDEDWYIPYNGPYEAPRELPARRKARDSWGDPLEPDDEEDMVLDDRELHLRYGGYNNPSYGGRPLEEERIGRRRDRTLSVTSRQTVSSGAIDPSRPSIGANRPSTASAGTRQNPSSYLSMDITGGVGESPIPPRRSSQERNRISLAGIFNFNALPRKRCAPTAASTEHGISGSFMRKPSLLQRSNVGTSCDKMDAPTRYGSSPEHPNPPAKNKHQQLHRQVMLHADRISSDSTEADYYDSYYSTLVHDQRSEPAPNHRQRRRLSPSHSEDLHRPRQPPSNQSTPDRQNSFSTRPVHPYAREIPRNTQTPPVLLRSTYTPSSRNADSIDPPNSSFTRLASSRTPKLKNSISTPDLRSAAVFHNTIVTPRIPVANLMPQQNGTSFAIPKIKDRWLSAETWCDAVLFPRPRLKAGIVPPLGGGSGRIVSPPGSPILPDLTGVREPGVASRVLAHSLSLVDLNSQVGLSSNYVYPRTSTSRWYERDPQTSRAGVQPTTQDLAHVLEQGQQLANERRTWQLQAQSSFGNKRTRTLVKTRSKSLVQNGRRTGHQVQTSIDYLATQACLGNQNLNASLSATELNTTNTTSSRSKGSRSQSNSLKKSLSRSSKSHSRNHSRGDSWSKSAAKMAKSTVAICGISSSDDEVPVLREGDVRAASLEGALRGAGTRVIRLADPVHIPIDRGLPITSSPTSLTRRTPSISNRSDQGVGIALGTPPLEDDQSDLYYRPSHPYAQGGLSFSVAGPSRSFAGPHPSVNSDVDISQIPDTLARHKLPPHMHLHPYAQGSARDSYLDQNGLLAQHRSGHETPHQMKMWAQLSPGVLREVLPDDFQYSPYIPEKENNLSPAGRTSSDSLQINDTIGVGETLVNAARFGASGYRTYNANVNVMAISQVDGDQSQNPEFGSRTTIRQAVEYNLAPSEDSDTLPKSFLTNPVVSVSPEEHSPPPLLSDPAASTPSSSPPLTPHRLGSPTDLEGFQDLFYRPNNILQRTPNEAALPDTPSPSYILPTWSSNQVQRPKTESSLTSLARQLSQEFKLITREREKSSSQHSLVPSSTQHVSGGMSRRPTAGSLEFVFEEVGQLELGAELPEDVESSRASSTIERADGSDAEDDTAMFRLGTVESISTPERVSPSHRPNSYAGETSGATTNNEGRPQDQPMSSRTRDVSGERILSGLHPPASDATRSSYMTTSTASRMSGLSDFPAPPKDPHHMSLGAYCNETFSEGSPLPLDQQVFFGRNQDAGDLVKTLSSSS